MKPFDPTKPVKTRDGRPARIICTDARNRVYPVIALVVTDGNERPEMFTHRGKFYEGLAGNDPKDLINIPVKREGWINIFPNLTFPPNVVACTSHAFDSEKEADDHATGDRVACIRIEWEE